MKVDPDYPDRYLVTSGEVKKWFQDPAHAGLKLLTTPRWGHLATAPWVAPLAWYRDRTEVEAWFRDDDVLCVDRKSWGSVQTTAPSSSPKVISDWPDFCDRCKAPAYVSSQFIECSRKCCKERS